MKCDLKQLSLLLDKKLSLSPRLQVLEHLERCEVCFQCLYLIILERDSHLFVRCKGNRKPANYGATSQMIS